MTAMIELTHEEEFKSLPVDEKTVHLIPKDGESIRLESYTDDSNGWQPCTEDLTVPKKVNVRLRNNIRWRVSKSGGASSNSLAFIY